MVKIEKISSAYEMAFDIDNFKGKIVNVILKDGKTFFGKMIFLDKRIVGLEEEDQRRSVTSYIIKDHIIVLQELKEKKRG